VKESAIPVVNRFLHTYTEYIPRMMEAGKGMSQTFLRLAEHFMEYMLIDRGRERR